MTQQDARTINNDELAILVKMMRDFRKWTQEQLSEIAGLNVRTIQRVENSVSASFDTRRALARAFDADDIDCFNKSHVFPTPKDIEEAVKKAEQDYITLDAAVLNSGSKVGELAEWSTCDMSSCDFDLPINLQQAYAELKDSFRDFRDVSELYSEVDKLSVYNDFDELLKLIELSGFCIKYAKRIANFRFGESESEPRPLNLLYLSIFPQQEAPSQFMVTRKVNIKF